MCNRWEEGGEEIRSAEGVKKEKQLKKCTECKGESIMEEPTKNSIYSIHWRKGLFYRVTRLRSGIYMIILGVCTLVYFVVKTSYFGLEGFSHLI